MHCCNAKNKRGNTDVVLLLTHGNLNFFMPFPTCLAVFISQEVIAIVSLVTKHGGGVAGVSGPFQPDAGWVGVLAPELRLLTQPREQREAFAQEQADTGQDFCLMHCQAKKLLWEVKFFMGGKNTAVI